MYNYYKLQNSLTYVTIEDIRKDRSLLAKLGYEEMVRIQADHPYTFEQLTQVTY